ncbi:UNVERIFIED_CONTAM: hypothetical protein GTU68_003209, partial [Idotea baltica]|nr:hypothetical protein [Idotea baltica]
WTAWTARSASASRTRRRASKDSSQTSPPRWTDSRSCAKFWVRTQPSPRKSKTESSFEGLPSTQNSPTDRSHTTSCRRVRRNRLPSITSLLTSSPIMQASLEKHSFSSSERTCPQTFFPPVLQGYKDRICLTPHQWCIKQFLLAMPAD